MMKKIFLLSTVLFIFLINNISYAQISLSEIENNYGKFYPSASDKKLRTDGKNALVDAIVYYRKHGTLRYSDLQNFSIRIPSGYDGRNIREHITVDPSSKYNRSYRLNGYDGIFLNPFNTNHHLITDKSTGKIYVIGCANEEIHIQIVPIITTKTTEVTGTPNTGVVEENNLSTSTSTSTTSSAGTGFVYRNNNLGFDSYKDFSTCNIQYWMRKYPEKFFIYFGKNRINADSKYLWQKGYNLDSFDGMGKEGLRLKKCLTGKTWFGRNLAVSIPTGTVILGGAAILVASLLKNSDGGGFDPGHNQD